MELNIEFANKIQNVYVKQCKELCKKVHLTQTAFDILMFLSNNPKYTNAKDIVEVRKLKPNLVSVNVDRLVKEGYLERKEVKGDRRKVKLKVTEKACEIVATGRKVQGKFAKKICEGISEEELIVMQKCFRMMDKNLEKMMEE